MAGDNNRLYFKNFDRRPDDEEFAEVMKILKEEGAIISDKYIAQSGLWNSDERRPKGKHY